MQKKCIKKMNPKKKIKKKNRKLILCVRNLLDPIL
jgi:hypothetical protein